jgi:hypothetical protein
MKGSPVAKKTRIKNTQARINQLRLEGNEEAAQWLEKQLSSMLSSDTETHSPTPYFGNSTGLGTPRQETRTSMDLSAVSASRSRLNSRGKRPVRSSFDVLRNGPGREPLQDGSATSRMRHASWMRRSRLSYGDPEEYVSTVKKALRQGLTVDQAHRKAQRDLATEVDGIELPDGWYMQKGE